MESYLREEEKNSDKLQRVFRGLFGNEENIATLVQEKAGYLFNIPHSEGFDIITSKIRTDITLFGRTWQIYKKIFKKLLLKS